MESMCMISKVNSRVMCPDIDIDPLVSDPYLCVLMRRDDPYLRPSEPDVFGPEVSTPNKECFQEYIQICAMKKSSFFPELFGTPAK